MNAPTNITLDKKTFLRWAEGREGRFELHNGKIIDMTGGTTGHAGLIRQTASAIERRLDARLWEVFTSDVAVDIGEEVKYPDVLVLRSGIDRKALSVSTPVIIIEVLSPSSLANDLSIKPPLYMQLPSLQTYVVASQDEPRLWFWQRDADGGWPNAPAEVYGPDAKLELTACGGLVLPLAEVYRGIGAQ